MSKTNAASLVEFKADLAKFADLIDVQFDTAVRRIVFELYDKITRRTPVDTGRARASWMISQGSAGTETAPESERVDAKSANKAQRAKVRDIVKTRAKIWIYNNLPYIKPLEDGSSEQAPQGMVALSVAEVEAKIDAMIEAVERAKGDGGTDE